MDCNFKVGQTVWCVIFGKGVVEKVVSDDPCPVQVYFERIDDTYWYTADGKSDENGNRTLFFSEPRIEAREFPFKYVGKTVLAVSKESGNAFGPYKVLQEESTKLVTESGEIYFDESDIHIVEQDQE